MGQAEQDCQDRTTRAGLPAQCCENMAAGARQKGEDNRKEQPEQNNQDRASRHNRHSTLRAVRTSRTAKIGKPEKDSQNRTSKMGQEDDGIQIRNARTGLHVHNCQIRSLLFRPFFSAQGGFKDLSIYAKNRLVLKKLTICFKNLSSISKTPSAALKIPLCFEVLSPMNFRICLIFHICAIIEKVKKLRLLS
jgi:hypothetical protein